MLHVRTFLAPSSIHGLGLFAAEPIEKGRLVFRFDTAFGFACSEAQFLTLPSDARRFLLKYGWRRDGSWFCDIDDSRFTNHSATPNLLVTPENVITAHAARDIRAEEELTEDYSTFDPDFHLYASSLR